MRRCDSTSSTDRLRRDASPLHTHLSSRAVRNGHFSAQTAASPSRSRSPRRGSTPIAVAEKDAAMQEFAQLYFRTDSARLGAIRSFRSRLLDKLRAGLQNVVSGHASFYDDLLRMSEVLFRHESAEEVRASSLEYSIEATDRRLLRIINDQLDGDMEAYDQLTVPHRVSAVHLALRLETGSDANKPAHLPDARTLMSLLAWRSELDPEDEVREVYSLATMKLKFSGSSACVLCQREFEVDLLGVLEQDEDLDGMIPTDLPFAVPKVIVPPCGHAMHSLCWCARLVDPPEGELEAPGDSGCWSHCRACKARYDWLQLDIRTLEKVFRFVFCNYLCRALDSDRLGTETIGNAQLTQTASFVATVCTNFQLEVANLVAASFEWECIWSSLADAMPEFVKTPLGDAFASTVALKLMYARAMPADVDGSGSDVEDALGASSDESVAMSDELSFGN